MVSGDECQDNGTNLAFRHIYCILTLVCLYMIQRGQFQGLQHVLISHKSIYCLLSHCSFADLDKEQVYSYISCAFLRAKFFQERAEARTFYTPQSAYDSAEKDMWLESKCPQARKLYWRKILQPVLMYISFLGIINITVFISYSHKWFWVLAVLKKNSTLPFLVQTQLKW